MDGTSGTNEELIHSRPWLNMRALASGFGATTMSERVQPYCQRSDSLRREFGPNAVVFLRAGEFYALAGESLEEARTVTPVQGHEKLAMMDGFEMRGLLPRVMEGLGCRVVIADAEPEGRSPNAGATEETGGGDCYSLPFRRPDPAGAGEGSVR